MHPWIAGKLAEEHIRDLQEEAARRRLAGHRSGARRRRPPARPAARLFRRVPAH